MQINLFQDNFYHVLLFQLIEILSISVISISSILYNKFDEAKYFHISLLVFSFGSK